MKLLEISQLGLHCKTLSRKISILVDSFSTFMYRAGVSGTLLGWMVGIQHAAPICGQI